MEHQDGKATQIFNSLLKKYIPDNSTFETSFMTPYEDDEPQRYEGTIHLLVNRLMIGDEDDDTWESVNYHDVPDWVWSEDFEDSIRKKIQPLLKSFNLDVDFDYKFIKEE